MIILASPSGLTIPQSQVSGLTGALNAKANDIDALHKSGDETASGVKTLTDGLRTGGNATVRFDRPGVGTVFRFDGPTGTTTLKQVTEDPVLLITPSAPGAITAAGIQVTQSDQTTMAAGLGQSGVLVGAGTIRFVGASTLSGFGGVEMANVAGVGFSMASASYHFFAADGTTPLLSIDGSVATLYVVFGLPESIDALIPNKGIAWSLTDADKIKVRTSGGVLKTLAYEP